MPTLSNDLPSDAIEDNCTFCLIAMKREPAYILYEDDSFMAFLDIFPTREGHTLVIPKKHYPTLMGTPTDVRKGMMDVIAKIAPAVVNGTHSNGFNVLFNVGKDAGQLILHVHAHLVPRLEGDGLHVWNHSEEAEIPEFEETTKNIRQWFK